MLDQPNDWSIKCAVPGTNIDLWMILKKDISVLRGAKCKVRRPQWYMRCKCTSANRRNMVNSEIAVYWRGSNRPRNSSKQSKVAQIWKCTNAVSFLYVCMFAADNNVPNAFLCLHSLWNRTLPTDWTQLISTWINYPLCEQWAMPSGNCCFSVSLQLWMGLLWCRKVLEHVHSWNLLRTTNSKRSVATVCLS